jgi:predicted nucleic acid-binding protein
MFHTHQLSAVDATSFTLMERHRISHAFTFDVRFSVVGFKIL